jgi:hypothetical protein
MNAHLAYFGIGLEGILHKDAKDSKEIALEFDVCG